MVAHLPRQFVQPPAFKTFPARCTVHTCGCKQSRCYSMETPGRLSDAIEARVTERRRIDNQFLQYAASLAPSQQAAFRRLVEDSLVNIEQWRRDSLAAVFQLERLSVQSLEREQLVHRLQERLVVLQKDNEALHAQMEALRASNHHLDSTLQTVQEQLQALNASVVSLQAQNSSYQGLITHLRRQQETDRKAVWLGDIAFKLDRLVGRRHNTEFTVKELHKYRDSLRPPDKAALAAFQNDLQQQSNLSLFEVTWTQGRLKQKRLDVGHCTDDDWATLSMADLRQAASELEGSLLRDNTNKLLDLVQALAPELLPLELPG